MPYRIDVATNANTENEALDRLVELGAVDIESLPGGGLAALMPDGVAPEDVARALGVDRLSVTPAAGRDAESVWVLGPRAIRIGRLSILPANRDSSILPANLDSNSDAIRLTDARAFGTGLHPTTALCLQALEECVQPARVEAVLDVGTGSGVLALAALRLGVRRAVGIDIDAEAVRVAATNARINGVSRRLRLVRGGPEAITGTWSLILANVLAAPLIQMAPALVRRLRHEGELLLSGIPSSVQDDVDLAYRRLGLRRLRVLSRAGWVALVLQASW